MKEALDAKAALQLVAREAGDRLVLHPLGRAWTTTTGADPASEVRWTAEWLRLRDSYDTDDLTRLAHAIRDAKIWTHLRGPVSVEYLALHMEGELREQRRQPEGRDEGVCVKTEPVLIFTTDRLDHAIAEAFEALPPSVSGAEIAARSAEIAAAVVKNLREGEAGRSAS